YTGARTYVDRLLTSQMPHLTDSRGPCASRPSSLVAWMISCLLRWTSSGSAGKSAGASTSKLGMGRLFAFMCVSSFSVALVICWARAIIRDVDCSGAVSVSVLAGFVAVPFASTSFWRRADRAEKERRFCFLASASALDE